MKKLFFVLLLIFAMSFNVYAISREHGSVKVDTIYHGGFTEMGSGNQTVTTAGTAVQLSTDSVQVAEVTICASKDNVGVVTIGGSNTSAAANNMTGTPIGAIMTSIDKCKTFAIDNLNSVYIDSSVNKESVNYTYLEY